MTYELFLTTFDRAETAGEAGSWLHEFVRKGDLQVLDVVVLAKRPDGSAVIREIGDLGSQHGGRSGVIVGGLLGAPTGPAGVAALAAAGAAVGAASELLASRDLYHDELKELEQALAPGASALLALLVPDQAATYARRIADFGGETMQFSMSNDDRVTLDCTRAILAALEPFADEHYIRSNATDYEPFYAVDPFAEFEAKHIPLVTEQIPPGELAIQGGARVMATDGPAGELTACVVESASGTISSIVVRLGDWPTRREQAIPIAAVEWIGSRALYLTLARDQIATLSARPLPRD